MAFFIAIVNQHVSLCQFQWMIESSELLKRKINSNPKYGVLFKYQTCVNIIIRIV